MITCKPGVLFITIAPAGMRLLEAIRAASKTLNLAVVITSACDGVHSGSGDAHLTGSAYDIRSHDFTSAQKEAFLREVMLELQTSAMDAPVRTSGGLATVSFFGFLESPGTDNEHFHFQLRNGATYSMEQYLAS